MKDSFFTAELPAELHVILQARLHEKLHEKPGSSVEEKILRQIKEFLSPASSVARPSQEECSVHSV